MSKPDNLRNEDYEIIKPQFVNKLVLVGVDDKMGCADPLEVFNSLNLEVFRDKEATTASVVNRLILEGIVERCEGLDKEKIRLTEKGAGYEQANYRSQSEEMNKRAGKLT